jgi:hypothetical protein
MRCGILESIHAHATTDFPPGRPEAALTAVVLFANPVINPAVPQRGPEAGSACNKKFLKLLILVSSVIMIQEN